MNEQSSLPEDSLKTVIAAVNIGTSKRSIKTRNNVQFFLDDMRDSAMMESPQSRKTAHVASELLQLVTTDGGNLSGFIEYYSTLSREEQLHTIESMLHDCEGAHVPGSMQRFVEAAMG